MGLRPGRCYRDKERAYTRLAVRVHKRNYIGAAPGLRIRQFNMGNSEKKYSHVLDLHVEKAVQIRDNALESARTLVNRHLVKFIGKDNFFFKVRVYPFHILRENKMAQGAGADRISQGMSHSFGKAIGRAIRTKKNQIVFSVLVNKEHIDAAKKALLKVKNRFPCGVKVKVHTDIKSIGTLPRKTKLRMIEEKAEEEKKEEAMVAEEKKIGEAKVEGKEEKTEEKKEAGKEEKPSEDKKEEKTEKK